MTRAPADYVSLSGLLSRWRRLPIWDEAMALGRDDPKAAGAHLAAAARGVESEGVNIGALYALWWQAPRRVVWRLRPETAERIRATGISYVPSLPPASWSGAALIVEGAGNCALTDDDFSVGAYQLPDESGRPRYFFVCLGLAGDAFVFSVPSDLGEINERLARRGELLDTPEITSLGLGRHPAKRQRRALRVIEFAFAFSFYLAHPDPARWAEAEAGQGPPLRQGRKRRVVRRGGQPVPLWTYRSLEFAAEPEEEAGARRPLDTDGLVLAPTVVRAHWRRLASERMILIPTHASRRWRRPERLGEKITE